MDPHEWKYAIERLQRHMDPHLQGAAYNTNRGWDTYREYPGGQGEFEPHGSSSSSSTGWTDRPCQQVYSEDTEDPDGEPLETPGEEEELESKMKKLRQIEEQILHKKASLAIKTIGLLAKDTTTPPTVSCSEQADGTLRDRVRKILLQHPHSFLSQVQDRSPTERSSSSRQQELHPLQLRVKALMKQRCSSLRELPANCEQDADDVPSQTEERTSQHQGFQRFLSVLNKGVDIDMLRRIVSDDREDLPLREEVLNVQPSGTSLPDEDKETKTEEKKDEQRERPQPESPQIVKKTKREEEEEEPKVDERSEQLQNVLKSLGLSLELEEMSRLADRTQERLYGKKTEQRPRTDSSSEQEGDNRGSHMEHSKSSCSSSSSSSCSSSRSSSSSSSRSSSRSCSPSPPRRRRSHSRKHRSPEERGSGHTNCETYQHPYLQNQTLPHPHSAASVFPHYSLSQYPCYPHSASYNAALYSHWSYTVNPGGHPYTVYPGSAVTPNVFYQYPTAFHDVVESGVNPDLCESEGQTGSASGSHCLTVIGQKVITSRISERETAQTNRARNRKKKQKKAQKKNLAANQRSLMEVAEQKRQAEQGEEKKKKKKKKPPQPEEETQQPVQKQQPAKEEEKRPLTEEEIKANLREKLEAFNQKMKSSRQLQHFAAMQPPPSLSSEIS